MGEGVIFPPALRLCAEFLTYEKLVVSINFGNAIYPEC